MSSTQSIFPTMIGQPGPISPFNNWSRKTRWEIILAGRAYTKNGFVVFLGTRNSAVARALLKINFGAKAALTPCTKSKQRNQNDRGFEDWRGFDWTGWNDGAEGGTSNYQSYPTTEAEIDARRRLEPTGFHSGSFLIECVAGCVRAMLRY
jgi:hypothetical protein